VYAPLQWAFLAFVVVIILAPSMLRPLARLLGYWMGSELRRRAGMPPVAIPRQQPRRQVHIESEVLPPERMVITPRAGEEAPIVTTVRARKRLPDAAIFTIVMAGAAVLLWWMLRGAN
jgi:Sec-independent protein translocase protein TatA